MSAGKRPGAGILVLGMHRSGTSALARVLELGGADIGSRVTGASTGNESGHWEDAFAVHAHEQLLVALGREWHDAAPLSPNWPQNEAAAIAARDIRGYLDSDRAREKLWVVKDPRLSLFASLWREAAESLHLPLSAVLVLRHPLEVANSLAARDGIAQGRGLLLWLEYTLAALADAETMPNVVVGYEQLLADWKQVTERIRTLPGGGSLRYDAKAAAAVEAFLDAGLRHHREQDGGALPRVVANAWELVSGFAQAGKLEPGSAARFAAVLAEIRELLNPVLDEAKVNNRLLWDRVVRAEQPIVAMATGALPESLEKLGESVTRHGDEVHEARAAHERHVLEVANEVLQLRTLVEDGTQMTEGLKGRFELHGQQLSAIHGQISGVREAVDSTLAPLQQALGAEVRALADAVVAEQRQAAAQAQAHAAQAQERLSQLVELMPRHEAALTQLGEARAALEPLREELRSGNALLAEAAAALEREYGRAETASAEVQRLQAELGRLVAEREQMAEVHRRNFDRMGEEHLRELSRLLSERANLLEQSEELGRVKASRSWRITRPIRVGLRLLTGRWTDSDSARLRNLQRRVIAATPFLGTKLRSRLLERTLPVEAGPISSLPDAWMAPMISLVERDAALPDVYMWSVIDWHFRFQRPQHLASALAQKGHRVFYISVNFADNAQPGFHFQPLDGDGRLYQIFLNLPGEPLIYSAMPTPEQSEALRSSLGELLLWTRTTSGVSIVQHPFWVEFAQSVPNVRVVYDCMDHHAGFDNNASAVLAAERKLVSDADLLIVTSGWLKDEFESCARDIAIIRNAGEFGRFRDPPEQVFRDPQGRQVIGYYGAIAEWFDLALVRRVAEENPGALLVLVGNDSAGAARALGDLPNVKLVGEVPYAELPYWLHGFDVCLLPFKIIPLTLATNPVKLYEYLSAGKPVVAVDLPEMAQFGSLVETAADAEDFVRRVRRVLSAPLDLAAMRGRQAFAAEQTWLHRADELDSALQRLHEPVVSVVVLTYNNLEFSKACLASIEEHSDYKNLEVIVVDNASSDGSVEYLREWAAAASKAGHRRRLILNESNLGFAAGNNVGLAAATGDMLVMLNNDTYATPGWVRTLCNHLRQDPTLGLVGPVTNNIGNEAKIDVDYADMAQMIINAGHYTRRRPGRLMAMQTVAFFCVALPRALYEAIGGLDEAFGQGFFEDDDYCRRAQDAGWKVACAEDVFVHHHLSASFNKVNPEARAALFERNKAIYELKWGTWQPHVYRDEKKPVAEAR